MPDAAHTSFADFVARDREDLLRLAVLLEDDRADAEELVRGVLVTVRARWRRLSRRGDPFSEARRLLVRRVLTRRSSDGPRTSGWVDDPYAGWDTGRNDELRRALSELPAPTRSAVVLSVWAGLPDREVGDLLRTPEDTVRGEVVAGLAPLRAALAPVASPWQFLTRLPDDDELRAELTALAEDDAGAVDPLQAADDAERAVVARRRRRVPLAVAAAAAAVVLAASALPGKEPTRAPAAESAPERERVQPDREQSPLAELPTRGPLADDEEFLAGLLQRPWENEFTGEYPMDITTTEDSRHVLYAGDVPAGRWALVVGHPELVDPVEEGIGGPYITEDLVMAWFTGPVGADADEMVMASYPYGLMADVTPALLDPPSGTLVVVTTPGDAVEVSQRVEVNADASDSRTWTPAEVDDGIAVAQLEPTELPWTWATSYRIFRDGELLTTAGPDGVMSADPGLDLPDFDIDYPGGPLDAAGRRAATWGAFISLAALGAPAEGTEITARVVEPVPGGEGSVALVTVTLPSGAYLVSAQWAWDINPDFPSSNDCGLGVRPADPPPGDRLLVAVCAMYDPLDGRELGDVLVASAPPEAASVRLYRGDGGFVEEHEVTDGTLVAPIPHGVGSVEAVTADGVSLGRSDLLGHWSPTTD